MTWKERRDVTLWPVFLIGYSMSSHRSWMLEIVIVYVLWSIWVYTFKCFSWVDVLYYLWYSLMIWCSLVCSYVIRVCTTKIVAGYYLFSCVLAGVSKIVLACPLLIPVKEALNYVLLVTYFCINSFDVYLIKIELMLNISPTNCFHNE